MKKRFLKHIALFAALMLIVATAGTAMADFERGDGDIGGQRVKQFLLDHNLQLTQYQDKAVGGTTKTASSFFWLYIRWYYDSALGAYVIVDGKSGTEHQIKNMVDFAGKLNLVYKTRGDSVEEFEDYLKWNIDALVDEYNRLIVP